MPAEGDPRQLLADSRRLTRRVRVARRVTWFPLLTLAAVTLAAIPIVRFAPLNLTCEPAANPSGATVCAISRPVAVFVYWPVALVLAYVAIAYCYARVARNRGLTARVAPYAVAGIALTVVATAVSVWGMQQALAIVHHQSASAYWPHWVYRLAGPDGVIGLALLVLAGLERHVALLLFTLGYLAVVLVPIRFGGGIGWGPTWSITASLVIEGGVLLLGGLGFLVAQRRSQRRTQRLAGR